MAWGKTLWPFTYKGAQTDLEAVERLSDYARSYEALDVSMHVPSSQLTFMWCARWADQAFPQIVMGHKYCAALLATTVPPDLLVDVKPPWRAFLIEMPDKLLFVDQEGEQKAVTRVLVQVVVNSSGEEVWNFIAYTEGSITLWQHGADLKRMLRDDLDNGCWNGCNFLVPLENQDKRVSSLLGRLIANTCIAMSNPENVKGPRENKKPNHKGKKRESDEPTVRTYVLGKPISLDCREAVRDYVEGRRGKSPSVQVLVIGHWKMQPYGPKSSLRKLIWREPFWRGPEDAPILVREHVKENP